MPYNTVEEATGYFSERYGFDLWAEQSVPVQTSALVSANQILDLLAEWYGTKVDIDQDNEFPRSGLTFTVKVDDNGIPLDIKYCECEIAFKIVETGSTSTLADDSLEELKAGPASLKFKAMVKSNPLVNGIVKKLLTKYGLCEFNLQQGTTKSIPVLRG